VILELMETKNFKNVTAFDIIEELDDSKMFNVLVGIKKLCLERIDEVEKFIFIRDITMRGGKLIGKKLSQLDSELVGAKFEFLENGIFLLFSKRDGRILRIELEYKNFAYLILDKEELKIEITLSLSPLLKLQEDGLWRETKQNIFSDALSFHCHIFRQEDIFKLERIIDDGKKLTKFQDYCYCFKNSSVINKNDNTIELNPDQQIINKISLLRQKISQMNFTEKLVDNKSNTNISKEIIN